MAQDAGAILVIVYLGLLALIFGGMWKSFTKAGRGGWEAIIPIYNSYVMLKLGDNPWWYLLLMLVPLVNLYAFGKMYVDFARAFGKGVGWGLGLWFLPFVFFPLLGFGDAAYRDSGRGRGGVGGHSTV